MSLLIKDLIKVFPEISAALETCINISNFEGSHAWFRKLLHEFQRMVYGKVHEIVSQVMLPCCKCLGTLTYFHD